MKRKVNRVGTNTLTVSLPSRWAKQHKLKPGHEVELIESQDTLTIALSEKKRGRRSLTLDVTGFNDNTLRKTMGVLYKAGFDDFTIRYDSANQLEIIQYMIQKHFIGFEIVKDGNNLVVVKSVSEISVDEFDTMLKRAFMFIMAIADESLTAWSKKDYDLLEELILRDTHVNKFVNYCLRTINTKKVPYDNTPALYNLIDGLEKIGDLYKSMNKFILRKKLRCTKQTGTIHKKISQLLRLHYDLFFNFDIKKVKKYSSLALSIQKTAGDLRRKAPKEYHHILHVQEDIAKRIHSAGSMIMILNI